MTDLIKELRRTTPKDSGYAEMANAAADEIERLREALTDVCGVGGDPKAMINIAAAALKS